VFKLLLMASALYLARKSPLGWVMWFSFLVFVILTSLQAITGSQSLALFFPWRLTIYLVPLSTGILLARFVEATGRLPLWEKTGAQKGLTAVSIGLILATVVVGGLRFILDVERKQNQPERALFTYVQAQKKPGDLYLTPVKMQDFRLAASAPVYVDFKSSPYKDVEVLEWQRRLMIAERFYKKPACEALHALVDEGITHLVLERSNGDLACSNLQLVYVDDHFLLSKLETQ